MASTLQLISEIPSGFNLLPPLSGPVWLSQVMLRFKPLSTWQPGEQEEAAPVMKMRSLQHLLAQGKC